MRIRKITTTFLALLFVFLNTGKSVKIQIYLCLLQKLLDSFVQREYPGLAMKMKISLLNLGGGRGEAIARVKYRICSVGMQDRLPEKRENFSIITLGLFFFQFTAIVQEIEIILPKEIEIIFPNLICFHGSF